MTKEDALKIKEFRSRTTWRGVAQLAAEEWPEKEYLAGNQIEGMDLCKEAADVLGENPNEEPWN